MKLSMHAMIFALSTTVIGCHDKPAEGPMESAGKKVDEAAEDTKEAAEDAADDTKEAVDDASDDLKKKD